MNVSLSDLSVLPSPVPLLLRRDDPSLRREIEGATLHRMRPGVYAPAEQWAALPPWEKYLARVHAVALKRPSAVFTHESAAALLGLPLLGDLRTVHVLVPRKGDARLVGDIQGHHALDEMATIRAHGVTATTTITTSIDLARSRHPAYALAVADWLLRAGVCTREALLEANDIRVSARGRLAAAWALERATAVSESVLESVSRATIEWLGFPDPELQSTWVIDGALYRTDFTWPAHRIIGEADGETKYGKSDAAAAVVHEKRREDALRRSVNGFARWGWHELRMPARLGRVLEAAGLTAVQPRRTAHLHSLSLLLNR